MIYKISGNAILYSAAPVESLTKIIGKAVKAVFSCEENGFHDGPSNGKSVSFFEKGCKNSITKLTVCQRKAMF